MSRRIVINGRELSMNDASFIDSNSEWSATVGDDGSVDVDRLDLKAENEKLRELLVGAFEDMNAWQMVIAGSNEWGYGKGCLDSLCKLRDAMQELGMEVVV